MEIQTGRPPLLVLISGAPGAGKTVLGKRLSETLGLPMISKDGFKEILADVLGARSLAESRALGAATFSVLYAVADQLLTAGVGMILEANFHRGFSERDLRPIIKKARSVLVHCQTTQELSLRRYEERFQRGERHPCHFDGERIEGLHNGSQVFDWDLYEPLDLGIPVLRVDTTDGYAPEFEAIAGVIKSVRASWATFSSYPGSMLT